MDCEENKSRSVADGWSNSRADDGSEKEKVGLFGACAQRERFGRELSAWHEGGEKSERTTK